MHKYIFATAVVAALFSSVGYAAALDIDVGPGGVRVDPGRRHHGYYEGRSASDSRCGELRRACMHKGELGEEGGGNCRRYRDMCR
ncbi:MAG: hypothetical protein WA733_17230 [Methylocystis sp.]|jgi:hypothetical protein